MRNKVLSAIFGFIIFGNFSLTVSASVDKKNSEEARVVQEADSIRAFHFVLRAVSVDRGKWLLDVAQESNFNTVIVAITDGLDLNNAPWTSRDDAWSKTEFEAWVKYAKAKGIDVIPELKLLSHQEKFLQNNYPELLYNKSTYNVLDPRIYEDIVFPVMDEIIQLISPAAFHIGHDEIRRHDNSLKEREILPANLFLKDVQMQSDYLLDKNIDTWMWGDMLIEHKNFPRMTHHYFNGAVEGYGRSLRRKLPRSIVICDWHYHGREKAFSTAETLVNEGFRVLGATWKNLKTTESFSAYAAKSGASGMIASTWFHVQRREWDIVENILRKSGGIFDEDF